MRSREHPAEDALEGRLILCTPKAQGGVQRCNSSDLLGNRRVDVLSVSHSLGVTLRRRASEDTARLNCEERGARVGGPAHVWSTTS